MPHWSCSLSDSGRAGCSASTNVPFEPWRRSKVGLSRSCRLTGNAWLEERPALVSSLPSVWCHPSPAVLLLPAEVMPPHSGSASSEVAERALDVLSCFIASNGDLGVTEIAKRVGIDKSRVHRFLVALRRKGYVLDNPRTRRYSLGFRALELGRALARQIDVERQSEPV